VNGIPESVRASLESLRGLGGDDLVRQMVSVFVEYSTGRVTALKAAVDSGDLTGAAEAAHALKGSSRQLGLNEMADACAAVEAAAKRGDLDTSRAAAPTVVETYHQAATALRAAIS
jgi:HPt (histidine-containing phosphotransfer) domain-containing protein